MTRKALFEYVITQCNTKKTKHIALRYHFIKDHVEDGNVEIHFVRSANQLAVIFTKALPEASFIKILQGLGMMEAESIPKPSSPH